jgi:predicted nuclease of predicted toxin-antitoxin system
MKIKLDENIPARLRDVLQQLGHDTDSVVQEGLAGCTDARIWQAAQEAGRFLITQDLDFSDINRFKPGTHGGILVLRLRSPGREAIARRVRQVFQTETVDDWLGCFVIVSERKIRIRRP